MHSLNLVNSTKAMMNIRNSKEEKRLDFSLDSQCHYTLRQVTLCKTPSCHSLSKAESSSHNAMMHLSRYPCVFTITITTARQDSYFGLLVTSVTGFKTRVDPLLACFLPCMQWILQIHLWYDTYLTANIAAHLLLFKV